MRKRIFLPKQNKNGKKLNLKKYILFIAVGVMAISSVFMTVEAATSGAEVGELRHKESQLLLEKRSLEETLVKSLSMNQLQVKGNELGFAAPGAMVYASGSLETMAKLP